MGRYRPRGAMQCQHTSQDQQRHLRQSTRKSSPATALAQVFPPYPLLVSVPNADRCSCTPNHSPFHFVSLGRLQTSFLRALSPTTPTILFPAMNTLMYMHPLTARHMAFAREALGYEILGPIEKRLACGDLGAYRARSGELETEMKCPSQTDESVFVPLLLCTRAQVKARCWNGQRSSNWSSSVSDSHGNLNSTRQIRWARWLQLRAEAELEDQHPMLITDAQYIHLRRTSHVARRVFCLPSPSMIPCSVLHASDARKKNEERRKKREAEW